MRQRKHVLVVTLVLLLGSIACGTVTSIPSAENNPSGEEGTPRIIVATFTPSGLETNTPTVVPTLFIPPTVTRTLIPTATQIVDEPRRDPNEPSPTPSPIPFSEVERDPSPTPTSMPQTDDDDDEGSPSDTTVTDGDNLFDNPGFEGSTRTVTFGEILVFNSWEPWYCDPPFTEERCDNPVPCEEGETEGCNPPEVKMRRPEYKVATANNRVHGGNTAQQWFCFFGTCQAGVYQTIDTREGEQCTVGAHIQSWSNFDGDPESDNLDDPDGRANSQWKIRVDVDGGTDPFDGDFEESRTFTFEDGHYDKYIQVSLNFTAEGNRATVYFENLRLFPIANNDSYIDDAFAYCE